MPDCSDNLNNEDIQFLNLEPYAIKLQVYGVSLPSMSLIISKCERAHAGHGATTLQQAERSQKGSQIN